MSGSAVKVGATVVAAATIILVIMTFMGQFRKHSDGVPYYVIFDSVAGLSNGASVLKSGVKVGKVTSLYVIPHSEPEGFRDKVRVTIMLSSSKELLTKTSGFFISSNLMGEKWLEILPREGDVLKPCSLSSTRPWEEPCGRGTTPVSMDDIMREADETLVRLDEAIKNLNSFLGDSKVQDDMKEALANVKDAAASLDRMISKADKSLDALVGGVSTVMDNANSVLVNLNGVIVSAGTDVKSITASVRRMTDDNQGSVKEVVANLVETSRTLRTAMDKVEGIVADEKFGPNVLGILSNLEDTTRELDSLVKDVREITSDPEVKENLKVTLRETKETMEGANRLIRRVRGFLGDKDSGDGSSSMAYSRLLQLDTDMFWDTKGGRSHGNANLYLLPRGENMFKIGLEDIGTDNKFNFQYGKNYGSLRPRIGIIRSKPGIGADAFIGKNFELSVDAYNTSDVQVDLTGKYVINDSWYFMGGVRDAFDTKQGVLGVGKRF